MSENKIPKCYCCRLVDAEVKDYRTFDEMTGKYLVCRFCMGIDDVLFRQIHYEDDPVERRLLVKRYLNEEHWEMYGVTDEDIEKLQDDATSIISWKLVVWWNNGERQVIGDLPDDVAQAVDQYLTTLEGDK